MSNAKGIIKCRKIYGMRITAAKVRHEKSVQAAIRSRLSRNISIQRHLNLSVLPLRCSPKSKKAEMFLTVQGEKSAAYGGKSSSEESGHGFDNHLVGREKRYIKSADDYEKNGRKAESRIKLNPDEKIGKKIGEDQDKKLSHLSSQKTILRSGGKSLASQKEDQVSGAEIIKRRLKASRMPRMHTVDSRIVRRFPYKILFLAIVGTLLFMTIIYNNVQINEKTSEIAELRSELSALEADITDASLKVEKKNDLRVIEARAIELGMVKADQLSKKYVTIPSNDQITLIDDSDEEENFHMTGIFEAIRQKISDLIDTFR